MSRVFVSGSRSSMRWRKAVTLVVEDTGNARVGGSPRPEKLVTSTLM